MIKFNKENVLRILGLSAVTLILIHSNDIEKIFVDKPSTPTVQKRVEQSYKPVATEEPDIIPVAIEEDFEGLRTTNDDVMTNKATYVLDKDNGEQTIIGKLSLNEVVYRLFKTNKGYSLVGNNSIIGYVPTYLLDPISTDKENTVVYEEVYSNGVTTNVTDLRIGPANDYKSMEELKSETEVEILAKTNNDWYLVRKVNKNNKVKLGFVNCKDIELVEKEIDEPNTVGNQKRLTKNNG